MQGFPWLILLLCTLLLPSSLLIASPSDGAVADKILPIGSGSSGYETPPHPDRTHIYSAPPVFNRKNSSARVVIQRVSISRAAESGDFVMRIHTDGANPSFQKPEPWGSSGITVILTEAALAQDFSQDEPQGPIMAYSIGAGDTSVILRISFLKADIQTNVRTGSSGSDILIDIRADFTPNVEMQSALTFAPDSAKSSSSGFVGSADSDALSSPRVQAASLPTESFKNALLAATRKLTQESREDVRQLDTDIKPGAAAASVEPRTLEMPPAPRKATVKSADRWMLTSIVLDAGHGGWDEGAVSKSGLAEKDLSLSVTKLLGDMLERELGIHVVYTRDTDEFVPLAERGRKANAAGGKLFVSIHANQAKSRSAYGTETYFLGTHRSDSARVVMERENEVVNLEENADSYAHLDASELATKRLALSTYQQQSESIAAKIQNEFTDRVGRKSRGVKQAGFYVLFGASMPSVLVELGFLSNTREAEYLNSGSGRLEMARAIFQAIAQFKLEYEKSLSASSF